MGIYRQQIIRQANRYKYILIVVAFAVIIIGGAVFGVAKFVEDVGMAINNTNASNVKTATDNGNANAPNSENNTGSVSANGSQVQNSSGANSDTTENSGSSSTNGTVSLSALQGAKVGDVVHLGTMTFTYYNGSKFSRDIGWQVLAIENGRALLITDDVIDVLPYNKNGGDTWEQCDLRQWLNKDFYSGLPQSVKSVVLTTNVVTSGSTSTEDKVFLLSIDEANKYFKSDSDRATQIEGGSWCDWWLRSPGGDPGTASCVGTGGGVHFGGNSNPYERGYDVGSDVGVRPALWVNLQF